MIYKRYVVEDPTGGGEDGVLILPIFISPNSALRGTYEDGEPVEMQIDPELDSIEVEESVVRELLDG